MNYQTNKPYTKTNRVSLSHAMHVSMWPNPRDWACAIVQWPSRRRESGAVWPFSDSVVSRQAGQLHLAIRLIKCVGRSDKLLQCDLPIAIHVRGLPQLLQGLIALLHEHRFGHLLL